MLTGLLGLFNQNQNMKIYPDKAKNRITVISPTDTEIYAEIRKVAKGEKSLETACSDLQIDGDKIQPFLKKYKRNVDLILAEMRKTMVFTSKTRFVESLGVGDEIGWKSQIIDDLLERLTPEGTFAAYRATRNTP